MKKRLASLVMSAAALAACSAASDKTATGSTPPAGAPGEAPGGTPGAPGGDPGAVATPPKLGAASVRNIGRRGDVVRIQVSGTDDAKQTAAARVRFTDENDAPVRVLDTNWDGTLTDADETERTFHFDTLTLGKASFDGTVTIPSAGELDPVAGQKLANAIAKVKKAFVSLENEAGVRSAEVAVAFTVQQVKPEGQPCDAGQVESRCEQGLSCSETPATCRPSSTPALSQVRYFSGGSPRMVFRGEDADEDVATVKVEFLDNAGNPKEAVLSGEGSDQATASRIDVDARPGRFGTTFFVERSPAPGFTTIVPKIRATAIDLGGRESEPVIATAAAIPQKTSGATCDPDGFDACTATNVCAPGVRGQENKCKAIGTVRTDKLKAFAALTPNPAPARAYGVIEGTSVWDPPAGCVPNDATGRPEATIPLRLDSPAASLTITTALPETSVDTAVYVIPKSATSAGAALGCNDDVSGYTSTLTLKNVPAGEYTVVVESVQMRGGRFGIAVTRE